MSIKPTFLLQNTLIFNDELKFNTTKNRTIYITYKITYPTMHLDGVYNSELPQAHCKHLAKKIY